MMRLGMILVKNNYENKGDLVFRPLVRAYHKYGLKSLICDDSVIILGIINNNSFYELFTKNEINYNQYEEIDALKVHEIIDNLTIGEVKLIEKIIKSVVFNEKDNLDYNAYGISDLAHDRFVEYQAYENDLSTCNPYIEPLNAYRDFNYKCQSLKKIKKTM